MSEPLALLAHATGRLLDPKATLQDALGALSEMHDQVLAPITRLNGAPGSTGHEADRISVHLPDGLALPPHPAAMCLFDVIRTTAYLRGLHEAIRAARQRFSDGPVHVLYAGCGPYAPFAIPMMTQFSSDEVQFSLLDYHERSVGRAQHLVQELGLTDHVRRCLKGDATTYQQPSDEPLHIVVIEAMQHALGREPQAALSCHFASQLAPGGFLVPERIRVDAYVASRHAPLTPDTEATFVGHVMELTRETASVEHLKLVGQVHELPRPLPNDPRLFLTTDITVFGEARIPPFVSGLTQPYVLTDLHDRSETHVAFSYTLGPDPGVQFRLFSPEQMAV